MKSILITGATGNIGQALMKSYVQNEEQQSYVATRSKTNVQPGELYFDFEDPEGSEESLKKVDILFLLRPPHISDVKRYFGPIINACLKNRVEHIVFLSVQGAEKVSFIPHAKIEKLIAQSGIAYTFIRPSYFMQNLSTTLRQDIREHNRIFLPAGKAKFLWVDATDIGATIASILRWPEQHVNKAYTITGKELYDFREAAAMLSSILSRQIDYISPNLLRFYRNKRKEGVPTSLIVVMAALHFIPRFTKAPAISQDFTLLTGKQPGTLKAFIEANKSCWS